MNTFLKKSQIIVDSIQNEYYNKIIPSIRSEYQVGGDNMMSKNLKILREIKGFNQTITANYLGISLHSYCNKENGKSDFTLDEAKKISELFGLTVEEIFFKPLDFKLNTMSNS